MAKTRKLAGLKFGKVATALAVVALIAGGTVVGLEHLDRKFPPPEILEQNNSVQILDRADRPLHIFTNAEGRWRLPTKITEVDPEYLRLLLAYEDRRFYSHFGVDPLAISRAAWQFVRHQRIVSGASTITMQLARLLEPRKKRSFTTKLRQIARAFQLERRYTKEQILEGYLTLAPYGGNIEGVRAAALSWFGKEPKRLSLNQAALLVALPQSPEARRPDKRPAAALSARNRVLARLAEAGALKPSEAERAGKFNVPKVRRKLPALAPHLASAAIDLDPLAQHYQDKARPENSVALGTGAFAIRSQI